MIFCIEEGLIKKYAEFEKKIAFYKKIVYFFKKIDLN